MSDRHHQANRIAEFELAVREATTEAMRADGADEATIEAALARSHGVVVWAHRRERTKGSRRTTVEDGGAEPLTAEAVSRIVRRVTGRAGGRPPDLTDFRDEERLGDTIRAMVRDKARITRPTLAARLGITEAALRGYLGGTGRTMREIVIQYSTR